MKNLFAYGTLMCEDIMSEVAGVDLTHVPGTLRGYSRRSVIGEHYPAITPDENAAVEGVLYCDLPDSAWDHLDRFEGEMYERCAVDVELADGTILSAETYVTRPAYQNHLSDTEWDFDYFLMAGKTCFQSHYKGYRSL